MFWNKEFDNITCLLHKGYVINDVTAFGGEVTDSDGFFSSKNQDNEGRGLKIFKIA